MSFPAGGESAAACSAGLLWDQGGSPCGDHAVVDVTCRTVKFLGLCLDQMLKFEGRIAQLNSKLASGCFALRTVSCNSGIHIARSLLFSQKIVSEI